ncbi:MAG: hypothetical protein ACYC1D_13160 [Acidimicrobiales bacterium]
MASSLPLADNEVDVILIGSQLSVTEAVSTHLQMLLEFEVSVFATFLDPRVTTLPRDELAAKLPGYDHVVTF